MNPTEMNINAEIAYWQHRAINTRHRLYRRLCQQRADWLRARRDREESTRCPTSDQTAG